MNIITLLTINRVHTYYITHNVWYRVTSNKLFDLSWTNYVWYVMHCTHLHIILVITQNENNIMDKVRKKTYKAVFTYAVQDDTIRRTILYTVCYHTYLSFVIPERLKPPITSHQVNIQSYIILCTRYSNI